MLSRRHLIRKSVDGDLASPADMFPLFLRWLIVFLLLMCLGLATLIVNDYLNKRQIRIADSHRSVAYAIGGLEVIFRDIQSDLKSLAASNSLARVIDGQPGARQELAAEWLQFALHKGFYDQVRLLDAFGKEQVRINYNNGRPSVAAEEQLQDKSGRYYFANTIPLGKGEIFVSPLDLNIERGEVEVPLKPMVRLGMPVFDRFGDKQGIILLNYLADDLLQRFKSAAGQAPGDMYLLNAGGYWLSSPNSADEWGFMFDTRRQLNFGQRFPEAWARMQQQDQGLIELESKRFLYQLVYPLGRPMGVDRAERKARYHWILVNLVDDAGWWQAYLVSPTWLVLFLFTTLVAVMSAWFISLQDVRSRSLMLQRGRQQAQEQLRALSQAVEQSPVSIVLTDENVQIQYVNSAFEVISGYTSEEVIGRNPSMLQSGETPRKVYEEMWQALNQGQDWIGEFLNRHKDGSLYWERVHLSRVLDEHGQLKHYLALKEDVTRLKQQEERITHQAYYDALTDLPNRFLAKDRLGLLINMAQRHGRRIALIYLDLDDFKRINDTLGHSIGDDLLVEAAERLKSTVRRDDTVVRLGGDEFLIMMDTKRAEQDVRVVAEHLLDAFRTPFTLDGHELVVTISIGIALYPENGEDFDELLRNADTAMYQSKQGGRNNYHYYTASMNQQAARRLTLDSRLRGALQRGDLYLHYQPIVDIESGRVVGAEALARWWDEELGEVSPVEFIPVAEQSGLIEVLGLFVLAEAGRNAVRLSEACSSGFYISVNVSPQQLRNEMFAAYVQAMIQDVDLGDVELVVEITEGSLMQGNEGLNRTLMELQGMGIKIAMDDFGTGYASLSYLRRYPFDILKIDRSFVNDLTEDAGDRQLVSSALEMAHALGLKVVAEGVELEAQLEFLRQRGCEFGQGYLFGKPMPIDELEPML